MSWAAAAGSAAASALAQLSLQGVCQPSAGLVVVCFGILIAFGLFCCCCGLGWGLLLGSVAQPGAVPAVAAKALQAAGSAALLAASGATRLRLREYARLG